MANQKSPVDLDIDARLMAEIERYAREHGSTPEEVIAASVGPFLDGQTHAYSAFVAHHAESVSARWQEIEATERIAHVVEIVNTEAKPLRVEQTKRINMIASNPAITTGAKIRALWECVDEIGRIAGPRSACRRGCSHCCHTPVLLPEQEAELIGRKIGVKPRRLEGITQPHEIGAGYDNPCPFLKDNACSIYEWRPLACRQLFNMDRDALLCELIGDEASKVPYLNMGDYQLALAQMTISRREIVGRDARTGLPRPGVEMIAPAVGDIREFFPEGKS
jgi:Fe-S-cluster containining protein